MALVLTGLSRESAKFQARSAFTGVGFTTSESESILNHPVRRRIIHLLMLVGNLGVAAVVAAMMASMLNAKGDQERGWTLLVLLAAGLLILWIASSSRWVERRLNIVITWALRKFSSLDVRDYVAVLNLQNGYAVTEMLVEERDWIANRTLVELNLPKEGVLVLGVQRSQDVYVGAPTATTKILAADVLVLYGPIERLEELDQRRAGRRGEVAHREAISEHKEVLVEQQETLEADDAKTID